MGSSFNVGDVRITGSAVAFGDGATASNTTHESALLKSELPPDRRVFVVHGRDHRVRDAMFGFLRDLGLDPWEWEDAVTDLGQASPYSGDVVAHAAKLARAAVVLLSPDDVVQLHPDLWNPAGEHPHETRPANQARPNVLIELGMVLALYPERVLIAEFGDLRQVNDINGRNVVRFHGRDVTTSVTKVAGRLEQAGCDVRRSPGWDRADRFTALPAYTRTPRW